MVQEIIFLLKGPPAFHLFRGANYFTRAYLNGQALGDHEGGFTPFDFEITGKIRDGDNFLVAEVNNARRGDGVPAKDIDWWNYGGLTRDVTLVEVPETFIQDYVVQLTAGSINEVSGWVQLSDFIAGRQITVEILEAGIRQTYTTDGVGQANHFPRARTMVPRPSQTLRCGGLQRFRQVHMPWLPLRRNPGYSNTP